MHTNRDVCVRPIHVSARITHAHFALGGRRSEHVQGFKSRQNPVPVTEFVEGKGDTVVV